MTEQNILRLRDLAEDGQVQFKERIVNKDNTYEIGCEMVAFSNSRGGRVIIGINDKSGEINALSYQELQETTNLLAEMVSEWGDEGIAAKGKIQQCHWVGRHRTHGPCVPTKRVGGS